MKISRKEFLRLSAVFVGTGLVGCDDRGTNGPADLTGAGPDLAGGNRSEVERGPDLGASPDAASNAELARADASNGASPDLASEPSPDLASPGCTPEGQISANHGHMIMVSSADVRAGVAKTYDITGSSDHPHTVSLSAADFAALAAGMTATKTSSYDDGHDHGVTLRCA